MAAGPVDNADDISGYEYRWAVTTAAHSIPHVDELTYLGYQLFMRGGEVVRDQRYPTSVLMRRPCA